MDTLNNRVHNEVSRVLAVGQWQSLLPFRVVVSLVTSVPYLKGDASALLENEVPKKVEGSA